MRRIPELVMGICGMLRARGYSNPELMTSALRMPLYLAEDERDADGIIRISEFMTSIDPECPDALFWIGGKRSDSDFQGALECWSKAVGGMDVRYIRDYADIIVETMAEGCFADTSDYHADRQTPLRIAGICESISRRVRSEDLHSNLDPMGYIIGYLFDRIRQSEDADVASKASTKAVMLALCDASISPSLEYQDDLFSRSATRSAVLHARAMFDRFDSPGYFRRRSCYRIIRANNDFMQALANYVHKAANRYYRGIFVRLENHWKDHDMSAFTGSLFEAYDAQRSGRPQSSSIQNKRNLCIKRYLMGYFEPVRE